MTATKRTLAIDRDKMYALGDEQGNITLNTEEIIRIAEQFCTKPYASEVGPGKTAQPPSDVPPTTNDIVEIALHGMNRGKAAGDAAGR